MNKGDTVLWEKDAHEIPWTLNSFLDEGVARSEVRAVLRGPYNAVVMPLLSELKPYPGEKRPAFEAATDEAPQGSFNI